MARLRRKWSVHDWPRLGSLVSALYAATQGTGPVPVGGEQRSEDGLRDVFADLQVIERLGMRLLSRDELLEKHRHQPMRGARPAYIHRRPLEYVGQTEDVELFLYEIQTARRRVRGQQVRAASKPPVAAPPKRG